MAMVYTEEQIAIAKEALIKTLQNLFGSRYVHTKSSRFIL